jgi:4-hydroxybenzoate polyprenyltransferase
MKYLKLMRAHQWYKNLVIFIPLVFSKNLFNIGFIFIELLGFLALCLMSSCNYIINDIIDAEKDKLHPKKKNRPIASGAVSKRAAALVAVILFAGSITISYYISLLFILWPLMLFFSTQIYSFKLKNVAIVDIHMIAFNFMIRTTAGSVAINVQTSVWLFLLAFLLALFLALSKRSSELMKLGKKAAEHKPVFKFYTEGLLNSLTNIVMAMMLSSYAFYTFLANTTNDIMMFTIPIVTFILFRFLLLVKSGSDIGGSVDMIIYYKPILAGVIAWTVMSIAVLYII